MSCGGLPHDQKPRARAAGQISRSPHQDRRAPHLARAKVNNVRLDDHSPTSKPERESDMFPETLTLQVRPCRRWTAPQDSWLLRARLGRRTPLRPPPPWQGMLKSTGYEPQSLSGPGLCPAVLNRLESSSYSFLIHVCCCGPPRVSQAVAGRGPPPARPGAPTPWNARPPPAPPPTFLGSLRAPHDPSLISPASCRGMHVVHASSAGSAQARSGHPCRRIWGPLAGRLPSFSSFTFRSAASAPPLPLSLAPGLYRPPAPHVHYPATSVTRLISLIYRPLFLDRRIR